MNMAIKILIGAIIGLIFGFISIMSAIKQQRQKTVFAWDNLAEALNIRYLKLKNVSEFLKRHMNEYQNELNEIIALCDEAVNSNKSVEYVQKCLSMENEINYKLEDIKTKMINYPSVQNDAEISASIDAIIQSETVVGNAIKVYNNCCLQYRIFLETFPISICAQLLGIKPNIESFNVSSANEFDDNYIDEDEI